MGDDRHGGRRDYDGEYGQAVTGGPVVPEILSDAS